MVGVLYKTPEDFPARTAAMNCVPYGTYQAMVVSPLGAGRLDPPDNRNCSRQRPGHDVLHQRLPCRLPEVRLGRVGIGLAYSWGPRALNTLHARLSIPASPSGATGLRAGRRDLMALSARPARQAISGMEPWRRTGFRYPSPSIRHFSRTCLAGMGVSYPDRKPPPAA